MPNMQCCENKPLTNLPFFLIMVGYEFMPQGGSVFSKKQECVYEKYQKAFVPDVNAYDGA